LPVNRLHCHNRSIAATATFFATASVAANIVYGDVMTVAVSLSSPWLLGGSVTNILYLQAISFLAVSSLYTLVGSSTLMNAGIDHGLKLDTKI
jgi:hypothetical protein